MKRLTKEQKQDIKQAIMEDNKRIEYLRLFGNQSEAINAKRAKHLRPSVLASYYNVTVAQIRNAIEGT